MAAEATGTSKLGGADRRAGGRRRNSRHSRVPAIGLRDAIAVGGRRDMPDGEVAEADMAVMTMAQQGDAGPALSRRPQPEQLLVRPVARFMPFSVGLRLMGEREHQNWCNRKREARRHPRFLPVDGARNHWFDHPF
jgi:hypothetical protein